MINYGSRVWVKAWCPKLLFLGNLLCQKKNSEEKKFMNTFVGKLVLVFSLTRSQQQKACTAQAAAQKTI